MALAHDAHKEVRLCGSHHPVFDVARQRDDTDGALAQGEGRTRSGRWQDALETFTCLRQLSGQERLTAMNFSANVSRHQTDDPFAIGFW